jgi:hypothetical protein
MHCSKRWAQVAMILLDHLVGARGKRRRHVEAECLRHDQVNDEVELGRLLDRKIGGLHPPQNLVD